MASYALPTAIPHSHHPHQHGPGHMHSHSHSPPSFGHLSQQTSRRLDRSSLSASHTHDRSHSHTHSHHETQNSSSYKANSSHSIHLRPNLPASMDTGPGWTLGSTPGGKQVITPTRGTFEATYDAPTQSTNEHDHHGPHHDHGHDHHDHHHHVSLERSTFTRLVLPYSEKWPWLHAVLVEKDSRRIFYFMSINFSFMMIQAFYGYVTDSLGLLSDSIHMLFDCVALAVGLFASVASKWSPSERFPYGFGKIETLSGFGNGIFLILISVEIIFEAFERIMEGRETKRLTELFIVSTAGLLVNLIGLMAFGHHHHGHDHGHSHGHSHAHSHGHSHGHDHEHDHSDNGHGHGHGHGHGCSRGHSHDNENMLGIYLHVLADTLGSGAVIVSTVLTHIFPWAGWDPLASFLIAVLILGSAMPLVKSSARRLLLTVPDQIEYSLRDTLSGITGLRGVASYSVPKFWVDDRSDSQGGSGDGSVKLLGVMHVAAVRGADLEDVKDRVRTYMSAKGIDITVQVEREGDPSCWCGAGRSPLAPPGHGASKSVL